MNCTQAADLLGAFALGALPADEAAAFRRHISTCAEHAAKARELAAAAASLPSLVDARKPPPALRSRVLAAVAREPQEIARTIDEDDRRRAGGPAPRSAAAPRRILRGRWREPRFAFGALAAALLVGIGALLAWNITLMNELDDRDSPQRFARIFTAASPLESAGAPGQGTVVYFHDDREALIIASGMVPAEDGRTYQMWAIAGDRATSIGLMTVDEAGRSSAVVPFDATQSDTFGITVEPAGGSAQPTSPPVFTARIEG